MKIFKKLLLGLFVVTSIALPIQDFSGGVHNWILDHPDGFEASLTHSLVPERSNASATFVRATTATVWGYDASDNWVLMTVASGEARFKGARRISEGVWSNLLSTGVPIAESTLKGVMLEGEGTNLFLNSDVPVTQTITIVDATAYTIKVTGSGSIALSGGGSGTVDESGHLTFTSSSTSVTCTITGTLDTVQLEKGSFPTSYIKTVATAVTRDADLLSLPSKAGILTHLDTDDQGGIARSVWGDGKFIYLANDSGGLLTYSVSEAGIIDDTVGAVYVEFTTNWTTETLANVGRILTDDTESPLLINTDRTLGAFDGTNTHTGDAITGTSTLQKIASNYGASTMNTFLNGVAGTDSTFDDDFALGADLYIGNKSDGTLPLNGTIKRLYIWNRKIPNNVLEGKTTL